MAIDGYSWIRPWDIVNDDDNGSVWTVIVRETVPLFSTITAHLGLWYGALFVSIFYQKRLTIPWLCDYIP